MLLGRRQQEFVITQEIYCRITVLAIMDNDSKGNVLGCKHTLRKWYSFLRHDGYIFRADDLYLLKYVEMIIWHISNRL